MLIASNPYHKIQQWWGNDLDSSLARVICSAPEAELEDFISFAVDEVKSGSLPTLIPGELRPLLIRRASDTIRGRSGMSYIDAAVSLMLYSHQAAVENPLTMLPWATPEEIFSILQNLIRLRPFFDAELIHFIHYDMHRLHPSRSHAFTSINDVDIPLEFEDLITEMNRLSDLPRSYDLGSLLFAIRSELGLSLQSKIDQPRHMNILIRSAEEAVLLPIGLRTAALISEDVRAVQMTKLATLDLPMINASAVWAVRNSSEEYAEWRNAISSALTNISTLSADDTDWQSHAKAMIHSELAPVRERLIRVTNKSVALSSVSSTLTSVGYSGVGAIGGWMAGGNPVSSLAGAAIGKVAEVIANYFKAISEQRESKAILDLTMSFYPTKEN